MWHHDKTESWCKPSNCISKLTWAGPPLQNLTPPPMSWQHSAHRRSLRLLGDPQWNINSRKVSAVCLLFIIAFPVDSRAPRTGKVSINISEWIGKWIDDRRMKERTAKGRAGDRSTGTCYPPRVTVSLAAEVVEHREPWTWSEERVVCIPIVSVLWANLSLTFSEPVFSLVNSLKRRCSYWPLGG